MICDQELDGDAAEKVYEIEQVPVIAEEKLLQTTTWLTDSELVVIVQGWHTISPNWSEISQGV
jgi:hypothetical protein